MSRPKFARAAAASSASHRANDERRPSDAPMLVDTNVLSELPRPRPNRNVDPFG
jgi:hypothetical protein